MDAPLFGKPDTSDDRFFRDAVIVHACGCRLKCRARHHNADENGEIHWDDIDCPECTMRKRVVIIDEYGPPEEHTQQEDNRGHGFFGLADLF